MNCKEKLICGEYVDIRSNENNRIPDTMQIDKISLITEHGS